MQVFVPSPDFAESARVLDDKRLFKQLLEAYQLLLVILGVPKDDGSARTGWRNHPATVQWRDYPGALRTYALVVAQECRARNIRSENLESKIRGLPCPPDRGLPPWLGEERVHSSHRARLLQKDFEYYKRHHWAEADDPRLAERNYVWAVPDGDNYTLVERRD